MKLLTKINSICIFIVSVSFMPGCSLDERIFDNPMADSFLQTEADASALMNGMYAELSAFNGFKSNLHRLILYGGDDIAVSSAQYLMFNNRTVPTTNQYLTHWQSFYKIINHANAILGLLGANNTLSEEAKQRLAGECHFLRAFSYFYLVRLHGDVPLLTDPVDGNTDFYPTRTPAADIYRLVFDDFELAAGACLPFSKQPAQELGRATQGAAQAMLSLAHLTYANRLSFAGDDHGAAGHYAKAKDHAESVIISGEYTLTNNYADLFDVNRERDAYREVIFAVQHTRDGRTSSNGGSLGSELAYYTQPTNRFYISGDVANGRGGGTMRIQPWFHEKYQTGDYVNDYRAEVSFLTRFTYQDSNSETITFPEVRNSNERTEAYPYLDKYKDPEGYLSRNNENDFFIIRLAEVFLIKAEAENELNGPTANAYEAFNRLRVRARLADGSQRSFPADLAPGLTKEEFRLRIFEERGLELVGEGHRWFDAVRMRYGTTAKPMINYLYEDYFPTLAKSAPTFNAQQNRWTGGRVQPLNIVDWTDKFLLWPIPSAEIDANPNMVQNLNW